MADETTQPKPSHPGANGAAASGGGAEAKPSGDKPNGNDPVLSFLKDALGRDFPSLDEAKKSVTNLNSLVGDRAVADLRKKAESGDTFEKIVAGYAKENGVSRESARADLLALIEGEQEGEDKGRPTQQASPDAAKIAELEQRLDLADLLKASPEAAHVLADLKDLAKARGTTLQATYEASKALQSAAKAEAASNSKDGHPSTVTPSNRLSAAEHGKAYEQARSAFEKDRSSENADRLVASLIGIK